MKFWPFKRKHETRDQSFTDVAMELRAEEITGRRGVAELTGTVQGAVSLWENSLSIAEASNPLLTPDVLALTARSLGLTGESLWIIDDDRLIPVSDYDLTTRGAVPRAYRCTVPDVGGGRTVNVLAAEVLHFRIGCDMRHPWRGTPPLRRAQLSAGLLHAVEDALADVYMSAPLGTQLVPMPEMAPGDNDKLQASFQGKRGRVLLRESTNVTAAGGPAPAQDWRPSDMTPNVSHSMAVESWRDARNSVLTAFGVLPALLAGNATGPLVREAQRHLAQFTLQPIATTMATEASHKLDDTTISLDPLHTYDVGARARAMGGVIQALALAKESGVDPAMAMKFAGVSEDD